MSQSEMEIADLDNLAKRLERVSRVQRLQLSIGGSRCDVATEAASGILEIGASCRVLLDELMPKLRTLEPEDEEFEVLLDAIAEEYRHIHYHISQTRLFNYVVSQHEPSSEDRP